jgi:hypothetical protein
MDGGLKAERGQNCLRMARMLQFTEYPVINYLNNKSIGRLDYR